jgi:tetratricopeptide (TPR) repeat protein
MKQLFGWLGAKKTAGTYVEAGLKALGEEDYNTAEKHFAKALEMAEEAKDYDNIAISSEKLGDICFRQGKNAVAETHYRKAYRTHEDSEDFDETAGCLIKLGEVYRKMARTPEAEQVFHYAMQIYQQHFGAEDQRVARAASCLASSSVDQKLWEEAGKLYERAAKIYKAQLGSDHYHSADAVANMALCYANCKDFANALKHFQEATEVYTRIGADQDGATAHSVCLCYHEYGRTYLAQNKSQDARPHLQKAMEIADRFPGYLNEGDLADDLNKTA